MTVNNQLIKCYTSDMAKKIPKKTYTQAQIDKLLKRKPYDPDTHPKRIVEIMAEGDGPAVFCAENNISFDIFRGWVKRHEEFANAYETAKAKGLKWWEALGKKYLVTLKGEESEEKFNQTLWSMIMRNRFGYTEHRRVGVKAVAKIKLPKAESPHAEQFNKLIESMAEGNLTPHEAQQFGKLIESGAKIYEIQELQKRIEALENQMSKGAGKNEFVEERE